MNATPHVYRSIAKSLRDLGVEASEMPPFDAAIPMWGTSVEFGETDEGRFPFVLTIDEFGALVSDREGEPVASCSLDPDQEIAGSVELCREVIEP